MATDFSVWLPMPPMEGPPLPQKFAIYWPWYIGVTVTNSPVKRGTQLVLTFAGFEPNKSVNVAVTGGGGFTGTADANGKGTYSFPDNDAPGTYTMTAKDDYNHSASTTFVVTS
jgi:hypothetical protein